MFEQAPTEPAEESASLSQRIHAIQKRVVAAASRAGRAPDEVTIIAVSKTMPAERVHIAYDLGLRVFGENRVQEAQSKIAALHLPDLRWELIGHLQTNKTAQAAALFARVQSVDSLRVAEALNTHAERAGRTLPILIEVNVAREASKSGFDPDQLLEAAHAVAALPHLQPGGLMTIAPIAEQAEAARPIFKRLRELRDTLRREVPLGADEGWRELSMGMTDDFEVAIEEGATLVRIGRALFGERPQPASDVQR